MSLIQTNLSFKTRRSAEDFRSIHGKSCLQHTVIKRVPITYKASKVSGKEFFSIVGQHEDILVQKEGLYFTNLEDAEALIKYGKDILQQFVEREIPVNYEVVEV